MTSQVVPQVEVGSLTLEGLAKFVPVLAVLSADNVVPLAMVQMENLGSIFHVNGEYAYKVPDLLQRYSSTRLDRLGIAIGWRKGDAASLMAKSAGGQAISLLSMCLLSLYKPEDVGFILHELSLKVLPSKIAISSIKQLVDVAKLIASKVETLGFGNVLARQVTKIHGVYEHLGKPVPCDFLDNITVETAVDLFYSLTRALREESLIVRITGTHGMGHIIGIVMMMFPEDTFVTLENLIVYEGLRKSILIEFGNSDGLTQIQVESKLGGNSTEEPLPIVVDPRESEAFERFYCFKWSGWVADILQLTFLDVGLTCPEAVRVACCNLLMHLLAAMSNIEVLSERKDVQIPQDGLMSLLGPYPNERIYRICQTVWHATPNTLSSSMSFTEAYSALVLAVAGSISRITCSCKLSDECDMSCGWVESRSITKRCCKIYRVWKAIGQSLQHGLASLFVDASANTTIIHPNTQNYWSDIVPEFIKDTLQKNYTFVGCNTLHDIVMLLVPSTGRTVASSSTSSTIYATALRTLAVPRYINGQYKLVEGRLILNGRYHNMLCHAETRARPFAKKHLPSRKQQITPSCTGEHSDLMITIRECMSSLEMRTTVRVGGSVVHLDLRSIILASRGLEETKPCEHSATLPLESQHESVVMTTSIASPIASGNKIAIVQVQSNSIAQLLCCEPGIRSLLQTDCCLSCAVEQAQGRFKVIIVG